MPPLTYHERSFGTDAPTSAELKEYANIPAWTLREGRLR
jgi:hypothetical protein